MNERPIEYSFVLRELALSGAKTVLDVGTGITALPAIIKTGKVDVTAIDQGKVVNKHYPIIKDSILKPIKISGRKYDFICCISVLEHIVDYECAVKNMALALNEGGTLVMTFPYNENEFHEDAYKLPEAGYKWKGNIARIYSRKQIDGFCKYGLKTDSQEVWQVFDGRYWAQGKRIDIPKLVTTQDLHQLMCVAYKKPCCNTVTTYR